MQIHWCHTDWLSEAERREIEARMSKLADEGRRDLIDVRIVGRESQHHRKTGHEVAITCCARGREIIAVRQGDELRHALQDAFHSFRSQVRGLRDRRRDRSDGQRSQRKTERSVRHMRTSPTDLFTDPSEER